MIERQVLEARQVVELCRAVIATATEMGKPVPSNSLVIGSLLIAMRAGYNGTASEEYLIGVKRAMFGLPEFEALMAEYDG